MSGAIVLEGIVSLFAAIGVACVIWIIIGIWVKPKSCEGICAYTVVTADKVTADLQEAVHSLMWWQDTLPDDRRIILCGDFEGKEIERLSLLAQRRDDLVILKPEQLREYLEKQLAENMTRDTDETGIDKAGGNG